MWKAQASACATPSSQRPGRKQADSALILKGVPACFGKPVAHTSNTTLRSPVTIHTRDQPSVVGAFATMMLIGPRRAGGHESRGLKELGRGSEPFGRGHLRLA
jgi:hypothetical protein